jgi:DNA-binding YbaB/EbfC family protein
MFNPMELMGKLKEMQEEMENARKRLDDIQVSAESGGGMVKVTANANRKVLKIEVDPEIMDPADKEIMEDLIAAAVNKVLEEAEAKAREEISHVSSNFMPNIPGMDLSNLGR